MNKYLKLILIATLTFLLLITNLVASVSGKISGVIKAKDSNEPLVGANVIVNGTSMGAACDINGYYNILDISPGVYQLQISMIGYETMTIKNIHVMSDHTTKIDALLPIKSIKTEEVVVIAKRPIIQKDNTSSTQFVEMEELKQMPIADAKEGLMLQTGVILPKLPIMGGIGGSGKGETRYYIRGGSQFEVKWFIDGIRATALVNGRADVGGSFTNVNKHSIKEMQMIVSGFNPEYGEAQSGIVNIVTKEGGKKLSGSFEYEYGIPGQKHFGNYLYDRNTQKEFIVHTDTLTEELDPEWWSTENDTFYTNLGNDSIMSISDREKNVYDYTKIPDKNYYFSMGGPLYRNKDKKISFFVAGQWKKQAYRFPHPRDTRDNENLTGNISLRLNSKMKLKFVGLYNHETHSTLKEYYNFVSQAKYYRGWGSILDITHYIAGIQWFHMISDKLFYNLKFDWFLFDQKESPSKYTQLGISQNPNIWGYQRYNDYGDEPFDAWAHINKNHYQTGDLSLVGSVNWQIDQNNMIKTGFEARYNTYNEIYNYRFPAYSLDKRDWLNRGLHETYYPLQFAAYIQDKMEFESMILNFGVRFDRFDPNYDWFDFTNLYNLAIDSSYNSSLDPDNDQVDSNGNVKYSFQNVLDKSRSPAKAYNMISPRIGVSFPITEKTVLHFNYGHFYQMPPIDKMFDFIYFRPEYIVKNNIIARQNSTVEHVPSNDGDAERVVSYTVEPLKPEKTISFEVGIKHNFNDILVLNVAGYYKDVFNQTYARQGIFDRRIYGYDPFNNYVTPNSFYISNISGDYGDSRGFEISAKTLFSNNVVVNANYSFAKSVQGRATPSRIFIDDTSNVEYYWPAEVGKRLPIENSFSRPHIIRVNLFFNTPDYLLKGVPLLSNLSSSILYTFVSGRAFTYIRPNDPPDTYNNERYLGSHNVDVQFNMKFDINNTHSFTGFVRVTNVFNIKNIQSMGDVYYDPECIKKFVEDGEVTKVDGDGYDISYQTYGIPRQINIGLKYNF